MTHLYFIGLFANRNALMFYYSTKLLYTKKYTVSNFFTAIN